MFSTISDIESMRNSTNAANPSQSDAARSSFAFSEISQTFKRKICRRRGVHVRHIWYWNDVFKQSELSGEVVELRIDPTDVSQLFALIGETWQRCHAKLHLTAPFLTKTEVQSALKSLAEVRHPQRNAEAEGGLQ